ncbi:MAG: hypothetical protein ABID09_04450 [Candidatus Omnitrophota bacterium]
MTGPVLIIDAINMFSLIAALTKFRPVRRIYYFHENRAFLIRFVMKLLNMLGWSFEQIEYRRSFGDRVQSYAEFQKLMMNGIKRIRDSFFSNILRTFHGVTGYERARLSAIFGKYGGRELYFPIQFATAITSTFLHVGEIEAVLLKNTLFRDIVLDLYKERSLKPFFYRSFGKGRLLPRKNFYADKAMLREKCSHIRELARITMLILNSIICKIASFFLRAGKTVKRQRICALVFNRYATELCNCLPWGAKEACYLRDQTLSLYLPSLPKAAKVFYAERSDCALEYSFNPFYGSKCREIMLAWAYFINYFARNVWIYRGLMRPGGIHRWMSKYLMNILSYVSFFEALFRIKGTKVLWTMNADDAKTQFATIALNRSGGVSLGTSWSQSNLPEWDIQQNQHDIFFTWGERLTRMRMDNHDQCIFFVVTGFPADISFAREFERAKKLRSSILNDDPKKNILAFVDNVAAEDSDIAPGNLRDIYQELFKWLESDSSNFLVIKAKRPESINSQLIIKERVRDFCERKRALVLYEKSALYPCLAADTVFSASMTIPSLAAILGRFFVYYDIHGTSKNYSLGLCNMNVISKSAEIREGVKNAIEESRRKGYSDELKPISGSNIDPFADGNTTGRMRGYIGDLLKMFNDGSSNFEAVRYANEQYEKGWGIDTIIEGSLSFGGRRT